MKVVTMPFGKHRGTAVADLPADYLEWLATCEIRNTDLRAAVDAEIRTRKTQTTAVPVGPDAATVERLIAAGVSALSAAGVPADRVDAAARSLRGKTAGR